MFEPRLHPFFIPPSSFPPLLCRTRSGDVVRLVELLDEAKVRCIENITSRKVEMGEEVRLGQTAEVGCTAKLTACLGPNDAVGLVVHNSL